MLQTSTSLIEYLGFIKRENGALLGLQSQMALAAVLTVSMLGHEH
jgi:hypothetical protein